MKLENRTQLTLLREQCQEKRNKETCKILVCGGTGCLAGGSDKIFDRFSELTAGMDHVEVRIGAEIAHGEHVGVKKSGCHGFCEMGPLVRIEPYNYLYLKVKLEDCEEIFEKTVLHGEPVTRLMYKQDNEVYQTQEEIPFYAKQTRLVLKNCGHIDAEHIEDALAVGAYEAFEKAVFEMTPEAVIKTITQSNLRGRGGAGFQTGRKWSQVAGQKEKIRYVVCNGDEGDHGQKHHGRRSAPHDRRYDDCSLCGTGTGRIYLCPCGISAGSQQTSHCNQTGRRAWNSGRQYFGNRI